MLRTLVCSLVAGAEGTLTVATRSPGEVRGNARATPVSSSMMVTLRPALFLSSGDCQGEVRLGAVMLGVGRSHVRSHVRPKASSDI